MKLNSRPDSTARRMQRRRTPSGQPTPVPRLKSRPGKDGRHQLHAFIYPHQIVHINKKADLDTALQLYCHPYPWMDGSLNLKTPESFRYMIEWVYPTLRWYCKVYGEKLPTWLKGNGWAENLSKEDFKRLFKSDAPLKVKEWRESKKTAGERA